MTRTTNTITAVATHQGLARVEHIINVLSAAAHRVRSTRAVSPLLLAAVVASALVVVDQIVDQWSNGLAAWMVLWMVAFASLALFSNPARRLAVAFREFRKALHESRKMEEQHAEVLRATLYDPYMAKNRGFAV
jgi:hypothetical protein